jgi:putative transposase
MPLRIVPYLKGLLSVAESATCTALALVVKETSHDSLSRILKDPKFSWQTLLRTLALRIFGKLSDGWLIIDDTVIDKSFARSIENLSWIYCSKKQRSVLGLNLVFLCWSNGTITIPLAFKVWKKDGKKSKFDLALELLSYARNVLQIRPKYITFDSWYASKKILKRLRKYRWTFYSQLKRNRIFNGVQVSQYGRTRYFTEQGIIFGDFKVLVVKHGDKYFVTNNLKCSKSELLATYKTRWVIETLFRVLHNKLGLGQCQSRSLQCQSAHITMCLMSLLILERAKIDSGKTHYLLRREFTCHPELVNQSLFKLKLIGA